jgi:hypothetical protein
MADLKGVAVAPAAAGTMVAADCTGSESAVDDQSKWAIWQG